MHMSASRRIISAHAEKLRSGNHLSSREAEEIFHALRREQDIETIADTLTTWLEKGYSVDEIAACAGVLRREVRRVECAHEVFIDVVGTGGSRTKTFNVSTAAAFTAAGAGLPVAKHGNRAASSLTGSADALGELGVSLSADASAAARSLDRHGICFMFAPNFHNLTKELAMARRKVGKPTIFNLLGPVANPAGAPFQLIGVWDGEKAITYGEALSRLGTKRSWIVHGKDGLDEITLNGATEVTEVTEKGVESFEISPSDFGVSENWTYNLRADSPAESAKIVENVVNGRERGAARDLVAINAAAALYLSGKAATLKEGRELAEESIDSGAAAGRLEALIGEAAE